MIHGARPRSSSMAWYFRQFLIARNFFGWSLTAPPTFHWSTCQSPLPRRAQPQQRNYSPFYPPREATEGRDARALQQFQKRIVLLTVRAPTREHWRLAVLFARGNHRLVNPYRNPHFKFLAALFARRDHHFVIFVVHISFLPVSDALVSDRFTVGRTFCRAFRT